QLPAQGTQGGSGQVGVVHGAEGGVARVLAAVGLSDPGDVSPLLVEGDQRGVRGLGQVGVELGDLLGTFQVVVEQADTGNALGQPVQNPTWGLVGLEGDQQRGIGQTNQGRIVRHDELRSVSRVPGARADVSGESVVGRLFPAGPKGGQPLIAPMVSPETMRRWTKRKKIITGTVSKVEAAMIDPHSMDTAPK